MPLNISYPYIWLAVAAIFAFLEISTTALVSIWFVIGSLFAFAASFVFKNFTIQLVIFVVVSTIFFALTRPLAKKIVGKEPIPTNFDMLIGKICTVTEDITPTKKGRVKADGLSWLAQSNTSIKAGQQAQILNITGATLTVQPVKSDTN